MAAAYTGAGSGHGSEYESACVFDDRAYVLARSVRDLGPALYWAKAQGSTNLTLFADVDADRLGAESIPGALARRAALLTGSAEVSVVAVTTTGNSLSTHPAQPTPPLTPPPLDPRHLVYADMLAKAGARPVDDHGRLIGEVGGLEVARVVADADSDDGVGLEVGVGLADRELQGYIHGRVDAETNLRRVVAAVARHRRPGSASHPLSRIGRQRWLRSLLADEPSLVGATDLVPVPPLRPSPTVLNQAPAAAHCPSTGVVAVCQVGADLDFVPEALDVRARHQPDGRLVLVIPERDRRLLTVHLSLMLSERLGRSIDIVCPPLPWADGTA